MVTIRTLLSSGSGIFSLVDPAGITNDIDAASETTGAVMGMLFRVFIVTGDAGKEQIKTSIIISRIDGGKYQLRIVPELDPAGLSSDGIRDGAGRRPASQQGCRQEDNRKGTDEQIVRKLPHGTVQVINGVSCQRPGAKTGRVTCFSERQYPLPR